MSDKNNWDRFQTYVLESIKSQSKTHEKLEEEIKSGFRRIEAEIVSLKIHLAVQKVKSSAWGILGGAVGVAFIKAFEKVLHL